MKYSRLSLFVLLALSMCASACAASGENSPASTPATTPNVFLRKLAQAHNILIGAAVNVHALQSDQRYATLLGQQFDALTAENAMKFDAIEPEQGVFDFTQGDALVAFAQAHAMQVRGHNFVWHQALPGWLANGSFNRAQLMAILKNHITATIKHYRGKVEIWDVVNEAIDDGGGMRESLWAQGIGPDYIDLAFRWAHEADPQAHLFYNDYNIEGMGAKSDAVYALVKGMLQREVPIYGVGLQMHVSITQAPPQQEVIANMQRLAALGLKVQITEMDVSLPTDGGSSPQPSQQDLITQAQIYHDMLSACLTVKACEAFVLWGFVDRYSWLNGNGLTPAHSNAPLIYDENYHPKPAFKSLVNAFGGTG